MMWLQAETWSSVVSEILGNLVLWHFQSFFFGAHLYCIEKTACHLRASLRSALMDFLLATALSSVVL